MNNALRDMPAWGISLVVNLTILVFLHFIVVHSGITVNPTTIDSVVSTDVDELTFSPATETDVEGTDGVSGMMSPSASMAVNVGQQDTPLEQEVEDILNPEIRVIEVTSDIQPEGDLSAPVVVKGASDEVKGGVEGAMDRVAFEMRASLRERKTLVIWLFDASGSLKDRREAIADRFDNIYKQVSNSGETDGLHTMIWAYGEKPLLLTDQPLQDAAKLGEIVRKGIVNDESGKERVFYTVKLAMERIRTFRKSHGDMNKLMFIVTDERGDDMEQYLEESITLARRFQTKVFTIGNASVFGQKLGYYPYVDPSDGVTIPIPVDQGPEGAVPDALQLPFVGSGEDWKLKQMSASYGPYGLTRLCSETGGMFLITEDTQGRNFDRAIMRRYAPDLRPVPVILQEVSRNPAKSALVQVADMTYQGDLPVPKLTFRAYTDNLLKTELTEAQKPVAEIQFKIDRLFEALKAGEAGRDKLVEPRWQAAYDLAMGRLMAMRVRYYGYNKMLANMKVSTKSFERDNSNMWRLRPSADISTGPEVRKAAEETLVYLNRVIDEHPGTPWASLALKEKDTQLGWVWEEYHVDLPGMDGMSRVSEEDLPRLLLAEEEERMQRRSAPPQKRNLPNL
ncbi:MAG: VWA domain-containing protein [Planctomycetaceae bacterium]|nr:VWA domain-containing protein [Planctomycetaceae bacterium]MCB9953685.1 VWA domain-containing protein [Planctomycetaceae bacterium]